MRKDCSVLCIVACVAMLLASCGGASVSLYVTQSGTTLIVDGGRYDRRPDLFECGDGICVAPASRAQYVSGQVLVFFDKADARDGASLIARFGLAVIQVHDNSGVYFLTVAVPTLFEEQWVQAFKNQPLVTAADTNNLH